MQVHIPALHSRSKLTTLRCKGMVCIVVDFWDLISAPALMDLDIECLPPSFTDHCGTAPPAAIAALQRGTLHARFVLKVYGESSLQPELAIMESCGMVLRSAQEIDPDFPGVLKLIKLELRRKEIISVMWDVRRSADLPFTPAQLSSHQRLNDDSLLQHALQQQAWHAEFLYHSVCNTYDIEGPGLLSVL